MKKRDRYHVVQANLMCRVYGRHEDCTGAGWDLTTDDPAPCNCPCHTPSPSTTEDTPLWDDTPT